MSPPRHVLLGLLIIGGPATAQLKSRHDIKRCDQARTVPFAKATELAVEKPAVELPPLAKSLRIEGTIRVEACVSEAGAVVSTRLVSGHPILAGAAIDNAKLWRFKPDESGPFKTVLELLFSQGSTPGQIAEDQQINNEYFAAEDRCRESARAGKKDAVERCNATIELVEKLPSERVNERRIAREQLGHAYFNQRKFEDALIAYRAELKIALASLQPYEAELGYAYHDVALALHGLGRTEEAADNYVKAEQTMIQARAHIGLAELKPKYSATLQEIRKHYLLLLQQSGLQGAAAELAKRMKADQQ
jgi:tetratricopeptide (TPR) repeat protein